MNQGTKKTLSFGCQRQIFCLLLIFLLFLPFLDGGTNSLAKSLILALPFFLFLLGFALRSFNLKNPFSGLNIFLSVFLSFMAISLVTSASLLRSLPAFFLFLSIFLFFQLFLLTASWENLKWLVGAILLAAFLLSLVSFYYLLPSVPKPVSGMNLVWANYGHSHLADYLLLSIPIVLVLFISSKEKSKDFFFGVLLVFYLLALSLTFSRGAFLSLSAVALFLIFFLKPSSDWKKIVALPLALLPLITFLFISFFSFHPLGKQAAAVQPQNWLVKQLIKSQFASNRFHYWQEAWQGFRERPLFGYGWGNFQLVALRFQQAPRDWSIFAHNFYLQVLAEAGLLAFVAFGGFLVLAFFNIWSFVKKRREPLLVGTFGAVLASAIHSLWDYDWHFPAIFLTFLALLANLIVLTTPEKDKDISKERGHTYPTVVIFLSLLTLIFFIAQLAGSYFLNQKDYQKALTVSPWLLVSLCQSPDQDFAKSLSDPKLGDLTERLANLYLQDAPVHSCLGRNFLNNGQLQKAQTHLKKAVFLSPFENFDNYTELLKIYDNLGKEKEKEELLTFLASEVEKVKGSSEFGSNFGKNFYFLGKDYLDKGDFEKTIFWWQKATEFLPEWSYFHLELASLHLKDNDIGKATITLQNCLKFKYPKEHCQEYLNKLKKGESFEPPGSWQREISAIPDY